MTNGKVMDDLNALLEERARYEKWIAQLTAKREQTPPHVFERVRTDYAGRLDTVMNQLRSRGESLGATTASLEERTNALASEESLRRDARAEIELRAMVGEYSQERANAELAACDADIGRLESERTSSTAELRRLQEILALIHKPDRPAAPAPAAPAPPAPAPSPSSRPLGAPVPRSDADSTLNELAFLNSVIERNDAPVSAPARAPAPAPVPVAPPVAAPLAAEALPAPVDDVPMVTMLEAAEREAAPPREQTLRQAAGTPSFLKGLPTEQVKTLKCQECGTMNYPTEWYCERCGGELAAM